MQLEDLGYSGFFEKFRIENQLEFHDIGRVTSEHKERYIIRTLSGDYEAEVTGNLRFTANSREDFPSVGDWVAVTIYDSDFAIIHQIFPRYSVLKRQAVGKSTEVQLIAANIDYAFLVQAVDRDFNINRLERYLTICYSAKVSPLIVLTKTDLIPQQRLTEITLGIKQRITEVPVMAISNYSQEGYDTLISSIQKGKTYCMLGSSGVGKSTLLNNLSGHDIMKTEPISRSTQKGRHITSHRELIILDSGGILIDNPGMREVGIADTGDGIEATFDRISDLSKNCKYTDCTHMNEVGCAVIQAVQEGEIAMASYENYIKMEKEKQYFETSLVEKRKKEKLFGKIIKEYHDRDIKNRRL
ncbi:MAG: ribosome small subunit-dependent GTPase A [Bacteroidales bacterium]